MTACGFVPPYLLESIASGGERGPSVTPDEAARCARRTLELDHEIRAQREAGSAMDEPGSDGSAGPRIEAGPAWSVHTAGNTTSLPGTKVRSEGEPPSGDLAVDEAAVGGSGALALFTDVYGRNSYDDRGAPVVMTVHYGQKYNNAFWNGTQLVFGDGDGEIFDRFTKPVDVLGHELTHAVTEYSAGLVYRNQPGALNESMSDVFASCAKQRMLGQSVAEADWLIGAGLFLPGVQARALRDMAAPGTAYDDPALGRDPQVGHMDDYVVTRDDNGGVHLNSGIPNRAFHLAARAVGGTSWDGAGAIWYAALTGPDVGPTTSFAGFAAATLAVAGDRVDLVAEAWRQVGVTPVGADVDPAAEPPGSSGLPRPAPHAGTVVEVRRSGGFTGQITVATVDLDGDDPRAPLVGELVGRVDLRAVPAGEPHPDGYVYGFLLPDGAVAEIPEQYLTPDLRRLADVVLAGQR